MTVTPRTRNPDLLVAQTRPYLDDILAGVVKAYRNLLEVQPGFPPRTSCSGDPGGGSGGVGDRTMNTVLANAVVVKHEDGARIETNIDDVAARDLARLNALMDDIIPDHRKLREMRNLVVRWNYLTAGEVDPGLLARTAAATEHADNEARWCAACIKVNKHCNPAPRTTTIDDEQVALCDWCYKFWLAERILPPHSVLDARQHGRRITEAMVKAAVREVKGKQPAKTKNRRKRK